MMSNGYEKPSIELFMHSLHQEFPEGVSHDSFLTSRVEESVTQTDEGDMVQNYKMRNERVRQESGWPGQWLHNQWVTNHTKSIGGLHTPQEAQPLKMALLPRQS
jgi:hypothetical protein